MEKKEFKILFLDDEMFSKEDPENPAIIAKEKLEAAGYTIEVTDKMSEVIDAYYKNYFHLYILDIDMGKVEDTFKGNGVDIGEILCRMTSISNVVVYSARGKVKDWLKAANFHFYNYVHKEEGEEKLLAIVDEVFEYTQKHKIVIPTFKNSKHDNSVLVYYEKCQMPLETIKQYIEEPVIFDSLEEMAKTAEVKTPKLILVILQTLPGLSKLLAFEKNLKKITALQPNPNVIVCIEASKEDKQLLRVVNARPFRMLNIDSPVFENEFKKAIDDALFWFGENEIFDFPNEEQMVRMPMSEEEIAALRPDDWKYEEWEDDENNEVNEENDNE